MIRKVTQLELENFAQGTAQAEEAEGGRLLSVADVRTFELAYRQQLVREGKIKGDEELPSWAEAYQNLLNAGVRPRIAAYVAWATMPKKYRYPETQKKLAVEFLGLSSDRVISTWRRKFPEIDAMITELQAQAMLEFRPGAFYALGSVASDPSYRANPDRRLFFEMTQDYTPRQKIMGDEGSGVGRKLLDQLKKLPTAKLLETLGDDALEIMKELEEELTVDDGQLTVGSEAGDE